MSSVASHVHAASSFAASRPPQTAGSAPDNDSDPFSAMFDAATSGQDPAAASGAAQPDPKAPSAPSPGNNTATGAKTADKTGNQTADKTGDQTADTTSSASGSPDATTATDEHIFADAAGGHLILAAAKANGAKPGIDVSLPSPAGGKGKSGAGSIADKLSTILAAAKAATAGNGQATTNAAAQTPVPAGSTANPDDSGNAANTSAPGATDVAGIIAAVNAALAGSKLQAADSSDKPSGSSSSHDSSDDSTDAASNGGSDDNAATSAQIQQAAAQPVAAAITVNSPINAQQTSGNTSTDVQIGDGTKSRTRLAQILAGGKDSAAAQVSNDTEAAKPAPATGNPELKANKQFSANNAPSAPAPDATNAQQGQPATGNAGPAPLPGNVLPAAGDQSSPRAETFAAAVTSDSSGSADSQTASASTKADATGLPNFGIAAASPSSPSAGTTAPAAPNATNSVPVAGLAVAIASRAQAGSTQFDIRLDPPELGRIEVRLGVDSDGHVTSHITVDRADTLQLLQDQQPQLQQALDQAGLKTADNGLQFSLRDQSFAGQQNNNGGNGTQQNTPQLVVPDASLPTVQSAQIYNRLGLGTGVDIRV